MKPRMGKASSLRGRRHTARNSRKIRAENALPSSAIRPGSKQAKLVELLRQAKGASLDEIFLAPAIIEAIMEGRQPVALRPRALERIGMLPCSWDDQRRRLGFPA